MKTAENEAVRQYLTAVERETAGLPAERRQELLADLAEHIDVTLAERPAQDDATVRAVLAELGDPRTIAATALGEAGGPAPQTPGAAYATAPTTAPQDKRSPRAGIPAWITVVLLALATPVGLATSPVAIIGAFMRIAGIVMLWVTPRWSTRDKTIATVITAVTVFGLNLVLLNVDPAGDMPYTIVHTIQAVASLAVAGWLWTARTRD